MVEMTGAKALITALEKEGVDVVWSSRRSQSAHI